MTSYQHNALGTHIHPTPPALPQALSHAAKFNYGGLELGAGGEPVNMVSLDTMGLTGVSLLRIDAEGAEALVLYGAQELIRNQRPVISYEAGPKQLSAVRWAGGREGPWCLAV